LLFEIIQSPRKGSKRTRKDTEKGNKDDHIDPPLAKIEPISSHGTASVKTYLRKGKKKTNPGNFSQREE